MTIFCGLPVCLPPAYLIGMSKWTIQRLIDEDMTLTAYCHVSHCRHRQDLDLKMIRGKLGPDAPAMSDDLVPKLRCSKCGGREVGLIYAPDHAKIDADRMAGRNLYAKAKGG